ncbi:hypothetical protein P7D05_17660 [Bacillus paranthracis]|uniref:hypothetical protein n=1 Tax=Bacillus paranthracis TaxID=2026186 RepID=UPI00240DB52F|nr:hypothetical protein [Bacillus paranthracis]MDG1604625.1 hypothetical protein [Bacillus paranthracis]
MHVFYRLDTDIKVNRELKEPYVIYIKIHYFNDEFKRRIQNVVKMYEPAFEIKYKNFFMKHLQKDQFKIKLVSHSAKEYKAVMTGDSSCLYNLNFFDFQSGQFSFLERNKAEEAMYKIKEIIKKTLDKEALKFQQI